ncbi:MAG: type II toxin-antitoxin system HicA family toxin [Thermomicrobiales bacterium]
MLSFGPIKRRDLIRFLRDAGFTGPEPGTRHAAMVRGDTQIALPNPHQSNISRGLLARILRDAGISREEWEQLS